MYAPAEWADTLHCKKGFPIFPSPAGMSLTKLSLDGNYDVIYKLFLHRESLVSDIPAGDGNIEKLFLQCNPVSSLGKYILCGLTCRMSLRSRRCCSRRLISSGGMGSPLQVWGWALWAGRPGPFFVLSSFRHLARRFWNHTCNKKIINGQFVLLRIRYDKCSPLKSACCGVKNK